MKSIRTRLVLFAALVLGGAASSATLFAHHSQSQFEPEMTISIEGTLTKASWSNPHTLFVIDGKKVGTGDALQEWTVSKAGDKVTFEGRPRRDGQPELLLLSVTLADGKTFSFKPE
jgi:hypothetical protein